MRSSTLNTTCFLLHQQHLSWFTTVRHFNCQGSAYYQFPWLHFAKNYENWFTNKKVIAKIKKAVVYFLLKHSV